WPPWLVGGACDPGLASSLVFLLPHAAPTSAAATATVRRNAGCDIVTSSCQHRPRDAASRVLAVTLSRVEWFLRPEEWAAAVCPGSAAARKHSEAEPALARWWEPASAWGAAGAAGAPRRAWAADR